MGLVEVLEVAGALGEVDGAGAAGGDDGRDEELGAEEVLVGGREDGGGGVGGVGFEEEGAQEREAGQGGLVGVGFDVGQEGMVEVGGRFEDRDEVRRVRGVVGCVVGAEHQLVDWTEG